MKKVLLLFYIGYLNIYKINNFFFTIFLNFFGYFERKYFLNLYLFVFIIVFKHFKFYCYKFKNKKPQTKYIKRNSIFKKNENFKIYSTTLTTN